MSSMVFLYLYLSILAFSRGHANDGLMTWVERISILATAGVFVLAPITPDGVWGKYRYTREQRGMDVHEATLIGKGWAN